MPGSWQTSLTCFPASTCFNTVTKCRASADRKAALDSEGRQTGSKYGAAGRKIGSYSAEIDLKVIVFTARGINSNAGICTPELVVQPSLITIARAVYAASSLTAFRDCDARLDQSIDGRSIAKNRPSEQAKITPPPPIKSFQKRVIALRSSAIQAWSFNV